MEFVDWLKLIASVLSGLAVCIPLVQRVVTLAKEASIAEKSWAPVMKIVLELMKDAEKLFDLVQSEGVPAYQLFDIVSDKKREAAEKIGNI